MTAPTRTKTRRPPTIVTLAFVNRDATGEDNDEAQTVELRVDREAVPHIMEWYGAFCAGDDYDVLINGVKYETGINGEFRPLTIDV